ncbi:universal stress protein [Streptomyces lunaelactis]|uniref:universal stress protein n=1 Tax=Streptomyces lunaelactis TaxID=1535768 RepID=UPI0015857B95|nr:universal stress protein [Streptomyces lunaelactis]NUL02154.1 universal stress protein [Streptomyces lunaelactis]
MTRPVITAVDGSAESRAAAQRAAREARMRALPLHILEVSQPTARRRPAAPQKGAVITPGGATSRSSGSASRTNGPTGCGSNTPTWSSAWWLCQFSVGVVSR